MEDEIGWAYGVKRKKKSVYRFLPREAEEIHYFENLGTGKIIILK